MERRRCGKRESGSDLDDEEDIMPVVFEKCETKPLDTDEWERGALIHYSVVTVVLHEFPRMIIFTSQIQIASAARTHKRGTLLRINAMGFFGRLKESEPASRGKRGNDSIPPSYLSIIYSCTYIHIYIHTLLSRHFPPNNDPWEWKQFTPIGSTETCCQQCHCLYWWILMRSLWQKNSTFNLLALRE